MVEKESGFFPFGDTGFESLAGVLRGIIQHHPSGSGEGLAKGIESGNDHLGIHAAFKDKGVQKPLGMEKSQDVDPSTFGHRHFDPFTHGLPSIRHTGGERKTAGIEKIQVNVSLGALPSERFNGFLALFKSVPVSFAL